MQNFILFQLKTHKAITGENKPFDGCNNEIAKYDSCNKRGHHVVPRHREKSRPSIRRPTAGGWPSPSSPRPAPRGRWPRAPPAGPRLLARCARAALRRRPSRTARAPSAAEWGREGGKKGKAWRRCRFMPLVRPGAAADPRGHARKGGARRYSSPP